MNAKRVAVLLCLAVALPGQVRVRDNSQTPGPNLPAHPIGPNDLIAVSVYDAPEMTRSLRVGTDGYVRLPMLRTPVKAQDLLPEQLEAHIRLALVQEGLFVSPVVTVTIVEYHSRPINVAGAVKRPLTYQATGPTNLLDALTKAEGLTDDAGPEILVSRAQPGENGAQATLVQRIPVRGLIDDADPELNVRLVGGEEIRVPEVGKIFVMGNIRRPGAFPVHDASGSSVLKILALAEGLMPFSGKIAYIYRQELGTSSKNEIPIELAKIMARKAKDVPLAANDILYIPDNKGRRLAATTIDRITGFGSTTASGLLIWRR